MGRHWRVRVRSGGIGVRALVILALVVMLFGQTAVSAADSLTAQTAIAHPGATKVGASNAQQEISLAVSLKINQKAADALIADLTNPKSPNYRHWLTPDEFTKQFVSGSARSDVVNYLKGKGFSVDDPGKGAVITAKGSIATAQQAFNVTINDYKDTATGRTFYANDQTPAIPTTIAGETEGIVGLDNQVQAVPHYVKPTNPKPVHPQAAIAPKGSSQTKDGAPSQGAIACSQFTGALGNSWAPNQLAGAYNFNGMYVHGFTGGGQRVAVLEMSDWLDSDVNAYKACFGLSIPVGRILLGTGTPDFAGQDEVNLDIDVVMGMAPNLAAVDSYYAFNSYTNILAVYQRIANDNLDGTVSSSWGACEAALSSSILNSENTTFTQMATQGQSFFAAAGDTGSEGCLRTNNTNTLSVVEAAIQPYAVGAGGTNVNIDDANNYISENVWNDYSTTGDGAGTGGLSVVYAKPTWQTGPGVSNPFSNGKREGPDLSAPADPDGSSYLVVTGGMYTGIGGTSGAAPFEAVGFALINQQLQQWNYPNKRVGFPNPGLYSILSGAPTALHDVTVGDNCYTQSPVASSCGTPGSSGGGKYPATGSFDLASGVGSPNLAVMANLFAPTPTHAIFRGVGGLGAWYESAAYNSSPPYNGFAFGSNTMKPLACDFFGIGQKTTTLFNNGTWVYRADFEGNAPQALFNLGQAGDIPVCGRWDGGNVDEPGIIRVNGGGLLWALSTQHITYTGNLNPQPIPGASLHIFQFGASTDTPVVGDWDGNGTATPGVARGENSSKHWYLSNTNVSIGANPNPTINFGDATANFFFGSNTDTPIVGDWNRDGTTTPGIVRVQGGSLLWIITDFPGAVGSSTVFLDGAPGDIALPEL